METTGASSSSYKDIERGSTHAEVVYAKTCLSSKFQKRGHPAGWKLGVPLSTLQDIVHDHPVKAQDFKPVSKKLRFLVCIAEISLCDMFS